MKKSAKDASEIILDFAPPTDRAQLYEALTRLAAEIEALGRNIGGTAPEPAEQQAAL